MTRLNFPSPECLAQKGNEKVKQGLIRIKGQHRVLESEGGPGRGGGSRNPSVDGLGVGEGIVL